MKQNYIHALLRGSRPVFASTWRDTQQNRKSLQTVSSPRLEPDSSRVQLSDALKL